MPEFVNPHTYAVQLQDEAGRRRTVRGGERTVLSEYFQRYVDRGFLKRVEGQTVPTPQKSIQARIQVHKEAKPRTQTPPPATNVTSNKQQVARIRKLTSTTKVAEQKARRIVQSRHIVGRALAVNPTDLFRGNLAKNHYPISDNVGVGILSYNRVRCLKRLVESIAAFTDLRRTTVFISDDCSDDPATVRYLDELSAHPNFVVIRNRTRIGIAGNSNRLLRCLSRFRHGLLLTDDVEVLNHGWESFYATAAVKARMHHFVHRQPGVYGAELGEEVQYDGVRMRRVMDRPHGAVLAFTSEMLDKVGYFDEAFGLYGMEHVDWSQRPGEMGMQPSGFFDLIDSDKFFLLHSDESSIDDKQQLLHTARKKFAERTSRKVEPSALSKVPEITYVIPFRNFERNDSIRTVVSNVRAQRFPVVHIVLVEQDSESRIDLASYQPVTHLLVPAANALFNKSLAFNRGVAAAPSDRVILHDADMLAQGSYAKSIWNILNENDACHIGSTVMYANHDSTKAVNAAGVVDDKVKCERVVGYYEGGSLACTVSAYWRVGGFNEDYWGYGCEDCDFYARLSKGCVWREDRVIDFLHLWHSRVTNWNNHHEENKALEAQLKAKPIEERIRLQHEQLKRLGYSQA